jgi:hypothetical protein
MSSSSKCDLGFSRGKSGNVEEFKNMVSVEQQHLLGKYNLRCSGGSADNMVEP